MNKYFKTIFSISSNISIPLFNFLTLTVGIKFFGKENWGELLNILLWVYFYAFLINWGHRDYLLRAISKNPAKLSDFFFNNFITRMVFLIPTTLLLFIFFPFETALLAIGLIFLMYVYSSFESLIIYYQKFPLQLIAESLAFVMLCFGMYSIENFNVNILLVLFSLSFFTKVLCLSLFLKIPFYKIRMNVSIQELTLMFPFFLIVFSGWIHSKIDLYVVNSLLPSETLTKYQLLNTSFLMLQAIAGFILMPMTKFMYRISKNTAKKMIYKLSLISIPIILAGTFSIWFLLNIILHLQVEYYMFIIGGLSTFPVYLYIINIINLYKKNGEMKVVRINFLGALLNLSFSLCLTSYYGYVGTFVAVLLTQYFLLIVYKIKYAV